MDIKYGIYKYVSEGKIIYIGKTNSSLKNRINAHKRENKFQSYLQNSKIYYFSCTCPVDTSIYEKYLINKYKPILNDVGKYDGKSMIYISEPEWKEYVEKNKCCTNKRTVKINEYWNKKHQQKLDDEIRKIQAFKWLYLNWDKIQYDGVEANLYIETNDECHVPMNAYFDKGRGTYSYAIIQRWHYKVGKDIVRLELNVNGLKKFYENYEIIIKQQIERTKAMADKWGFLFG